MSQPSPRPAQPVAVPAVPLDPHLAAQICRSASGAAAATVGKAVPSSRNFLVRWRRTIYVQTSMELLIATSWDGSPVRVDEQVVVTCAALANVVTVEVQAPFHADPAPLSSPGRTDRLWEYEVIELFLLGDDNRYLEVELGPHGHYLALQLYGRRHVERRALLLDYSAKISGDRWRGTAHLPTAWLPEGLCRGNAYAIHGTGEERRYLAAHPVPGPTPDFHRLECFGTLRLE